MLQPAILNHEAELMLADEECGGGKEIDYEETSIQGVVIWFIIGLIS
jgi:hypothetical protein